MENIIIVLSYIILIYFAALTVGYCILLIASLPYVLLQFKVVNLGNISEIIAIAKSTALLTVIIPCYNEKTRVLNAIYSVLKSDFKLVDIIVVDDGSTDDTLEILKKEFNLYEIPAVIKQTIKTQTVRHVLKSADYPNLIIIDKDHGFGTGADSVNVGVNACKTPLFMTLDADTVVESEALSRLLFAFFSNPNSITIGGAVFVLNENVVEQGTILTSYLPKHYIPAFQALEYVRSFLFGRAGFNAFNGALCYAGAFTLFEKQAVLEVGGYDPVNFAYDAEIIVKLHDYMRGNKYPYTAYFASNAFSWTIVPTTIKSFWRQRNFWQRGLLRTFMLHKHMFLNPRYGKVGLFNMPFNLLFEILGPVVEFVSYVLVIAAILFNILALEPVIWALILAWSFAAFLNLANFFLNLITFNKYYRARDIFRVCYLVFAEMVGFRQVRAASAFHATCQFFWNRLRGRVL